MVNPTKLDCEKWVKNKLVNPMTGRRIQEGKGVYNELEKKCTPRKSPVKKSEVRKSPAKKSPAKKSPAKIRGSKKPKIKKSDCIGPHYEWVVGQGCYEVKEALPKPQSPKRPSPKPQSPKRPSPKPQSPKRPSPKSVTVVRGSKMPKIKKADCIPPDYNWVVGKGCFEVKSSKPKIDEDPKSVDESKAQTRDEQILSYYMPNPKILKMVDDLDKGITKEIILEPKMIPLGKDEWYGNFPSTPPKKMTKEEWIEYLKENCTEEMDPVLLSRWDEMDLDELENVVLLGPDAKKNCYSYETVLQQVETALKHNDPLRDGLTRRRFNESDMRQIMGVIKRNNPYYKVPKRNYQVIPDANFKITKVEMFKHLWYKMTHVYGQSYYLPAFVTEKQSGSPRFTSKRMLSLLIDIYLQARLYKDLRYPRGGSCCRQHIPTFTEKWVSSQTNKINMEYFKNTILEFEGFL